MHALTFEQAPPPSVPLRFFLTAPCFLLLAGIVLSIEADGVLASRWTAGALALTHLLTAGFMLQAMLGALFQLVPVVAGTSLWNAGHIATPVHLLTVVGAVALAIGFHHQSAMAYSVAVTCLVLAVGAFVPVALVALLRTTARGASVMALRLAIAGLLVTVILGATMALARAGIVETRWLQFSSTHVAFGLAVWGSVLLAGTAYLVVPMFQLTPAYPTWFSSSYGWAVVAAVGAGALLPHPAAWLPLILLVASFAAMTLDRQRRRRRAKSDQTLQLWHFAMWSVIAGCVTAALALFNVGGPAMAVASGVLWLFGGFVSAIVGMLYKIVPFVLWLYLQPRLDGVPPMARMLSARGVLWHWRVHVFSVGAAVIGVVWSPAGHVAGAAMVVATLLLGVQLIVVVRRAREALRGATQPS